MSANQITWTANAAQVATLEKAATAMNAVSWCKRDNTAQSVFAEFVATFIADIINDPCELARTIESAIDTDEDETSEAHTRKVAELSEALHTALFPQHGARTIGGMKIGADKLKSILAYQMGEGVTK